MNGDFVGSAKTDVSETRAALIRQFEDWLNCALTAEPPPQGLALELLSAIENGSPLSPIEGQCDLYSLYSAITALRQEVRLQSRTFKQLSDTLAQLPNSVANVLEQNAAAELVDQSEAQKPNGQDTARTSTDETRPGQQQIDLLLDLRDRFERGLNSVQEASAGLFPSRMSWWTRCLGSNKTQEQQIKQVLLALEKGYSLTLERLDQALQDLDVTPMVSQGEKFDCHRMTAVDIEETESVPEGTVVGVYRTGYEWQGEVCRAALVKVARSKSRDRDSS